MNKHTIRQITRNLNCLSGMNDITIFKLFIPRRLQAPATRRLFMLPLALLAALPLRAQTVNLSVRKAPIEKVC